MTDTNASFGTAFSVSKDLLCGKGVCLMFIFLLVQIHDIGTDDIINIEIR